MKKDVEEIVKRVKGMKKRLNDAIDRAADSGLGWCSEFVVEREKIIKEMEKGRIMARMDGDRWERLFDDVD